MSLGLLAPLSDWDGFEAACDELQACSAETARFLDAEMAELDRLQTILQEAHSAHAASPAAALPNGSQSDQPRLAAEIATEGESAARSSEGSDLVARLETLCDRFEGELRRATVFSAGDAALRLSSEQPDEQSESDSAAHGEASSDSYRRRLRALAEQVLILERDRCGTAAELAAARLRARELAREIKRQKNAFAHERKRWLRKLSAIERSLTGLTAPDAWTARRQPLQADRSPAQKPATARPTATGLTDELLIEAIMAKCEMAPESRAG